MSKDSKLIKTVIFLICSNSIFLTGCAFLKQGVDPIEAEDVSKSYKSFKEVAVDQIIIYASVKFAPRDYEIVARMKTKAGYQSTDMLINAFQEKAAELHANAIIVVGVTPPTDGYPYPENDDAISLSYIMSSHSNGPVTERIISKNDLQTTNQIEEPNGSNIVSQYDPSSNMTRYFSYKPDDSIKQTGPIKNSTYHGYALAIRVNTN